MGDVDKIQGFYLNFAIWLKRTILERYHGDDMDVEGTNIIIFVYVLISITVYSKEKKKKKKILSMYSRVHTYICIRESCKN